MARKGGRILLVLLTLLLVFLLLYLGGVGWGLPWWLKHRLGRGWVLEGYRFRPPGTVEIRRLLAPDSSWVLHNLQIKASPWDLAFRRISALRIRSLEVRWKPSGQGSPAQEQRPTVPVLVKHARLDTLVVHRAPWTLEVHLLAVEASGAPHRFAYTVEMSQIRLQQGERVVARQSLQLEGVYENGDLLTHRLALAGWPARGVLLFSLKGHQLEFQSDSLAWDTLAVLRNLMGTADLRTPGGTVHLARLRVGRYQAGPLHLGVVWNPPRLELVRFEGTVQWLRVKAQGWWEPAGLRYDLQMEAQGAWRSLRVQGLRVHLQGMGLEGAAVAQATRLDWEGRVFQGLQARWSWQAPQRWVLHAFTVQSPSIAAHGWGHRDSLSLRAVLQQVPLSWSGASGLPGTLSLHLQVTGPYRWPQWQGRGRVEGWQYPRQVSLSFPVEFQGTPRQTQIRIRQLEGRVGHQQVRKGWARLEIGPEGGGFAGSLTLEDSSRLEVSGEWSQVAGLTVVLDSLVYQTPRYGTGFVLWAHLQQDARERDLFLSGYDLQGGEFLVVGTQRDTLLTLEADLANLALAPLPLPAHTDGQASLHLRAYGSLQAPHLEIQARWFGDTLLGMAVDSAEAEAVIQRRLVRVSWLRMTHGSRELRAYGEALMPPNFWLRRDFHPLRDSLALYLWQWPLSPLLRTQPSGLYISQLFASGEVHATGTLEAPRFQGTLTLESPSVVLISSSTEIHDFRADLQLREQRLEIPHFEGSPSRGRVWGEGYTRLRGWSLDTVALQLHLQDFPLQPQPDVEVWVSGPLSIQGVFPHLHLDGNLTLTEGYITTPFGARQEAPATTAAPSPVTFRIRLRAPGQLFFINDVLQAELQADLTMEKDQPVGRYLSGELQVLQGTLTYLDRTFRIEEGRLVFAHDPNFDPQIDFQAVTTVQETILIRLLASGTLKEPQVQLVSDPVLPMEDLVSLLSFGFTLGQLAPSAATLEYLRSRSVNLAEALVSRELKRRLRLSELEIETGLAGRSPHFTVGFYLSPRVHIRYTHDLQSPSKDVFTLNYLLTRRLWLYVDRDRDSRLGVGLNWRYRF